MTPAIQLAEVFHPSVFIKEEMEERGYSLRDVVFRMKRYESEKEWSIAYLAVEMYMEVGPTDKNIILGDMAEEFATAFGVSAELFKNLEASWRQAQ
jgi:hypothetical protein